MYLDVTTILKIAGGIFTFLSGLAALGFNTRTTAGGLTRVGAVILVALFGGMSVSVIGYIFEFKDKEDDKRKNDAILKKLQLYSAHDIYNTNNAKILARYKVNKSIRHIQKLIATLDSEMIYAKTNCLNTNVGAKCKDYIYDDFQGGVIKFGSDSFILNNIDKHEAGFIEYTGLLIEFYDAKIGSDTKDFLGSKRANNKILGGLTVAPWNFRHETLYEYDGEDFLWSIYAKLPDRDIKDARISSVVDLVGKSAILIPVFSYEDQCIDRRAEASTKCNKEISEFRQNVVPISAFISFPHRRNVDLYTGLSEFISKQGVLYKYKNLPEDIEQFQINLESVQ